MPEETSTLHFIDSHCHVDAPDFDEDREAMLERAAEAGIAEMIVVGASGSLAEAQATVEFAKSRPNIHATVGVHPHHAHKLDSSWWPQLCELAARPEVVAVGETGLDFYYDNAPRAEQAQRFEDHIELAAKLGKPLICHIRDAHDEAGEILRKHAAGKVDTIIHCFTGTPSNARNYVDMGFYVSFSGIVCFKGKSTRPVREAVAEVPPELLLIETDCPYLAPVPMRGQRNEPAFLVETAAVVAAQAGLELAQLAAITVENTRRVFTLTSP
jgi:TatD DNase family protein